MYDSSFARTFAYLVNAVTSPRACRYECAPSRHEEIEALVALLQSGLFLTY